MKVIFLGIPAIIHYKFVVSTEQDLQCLIVDSFQHLAKCSFDFKKNLDVVDLNQIASLKSSNFLDQFSIKCNE